MEKLNQLFKVWWESIFYLHIPEVSPNMTKNGRWWGTHMFKRRYISSTHSEFSFRSETFQASHPLVGFRGMFFFFLGQKWKVGILWGCPSWTGRTGLRFRGLYITCRWEKPAWRFHRISVLLKDLRAEKRLTSHRERLDKLWDGCSPEEEMFENEQPRAGEGLNDWHLLIEDLWRK